MRRLRAVLATAVAATLALSGCTGFDIPLPTETATPTLEDVPAELQPYYRQQIVWEPCEPGFQCATAIAPLDWEDPAGERIELALVRRPASGGDDRRLGALFVNPGGPGGSGVELVTSGPFRAASRRVLERYDLIGFDPRGVGRSTAVRCTADDAEKDESFFETIPGEPGTPEWLAAARASVAEWAEACAEHSGELLAHVDTGSAARDLDMLRAAIGQTELHYLGYSYGTYLGARYAELFPDRVGRFVLDGAMDPTTDGTALTIGQTRGFELALTHWMENCIGQQDCPFRGSVTGSLARVARILASVENSPLRHDDGRQLTAQLLFTAIIVPLYDPASWGMLTQLFTEIEQGETSTAFLLIDSLYERNPDGTYRNNQSEAQLAINCLDIPFDPSDEAMAAEAELLREVAPVFGPYMAWGGISCEFWPYPVVGERRPITAEGAGDIVVIGTTGDPATPYEWSVALADQLESGHLITYDGDGHTAYNRGASGCVDDAVDAWLLEGELPAPGRRC